MKCKTYFGTNLVSLFFFLVILCNFFLSVNFIVPVKVHILPLTMRNIIIYVDRWWEKYLSKRSPLKHTCSWRGNSSLQLQNFYLLKQGVKYHNIVFIFLDFRTRSNAPTAMNCNSEWLTNSKVAVLWLASHWLALLNHSISAVFDFCEILLNTQTLICWMRVSYPVAPWNRIPFL